MDAGLYVYSRCPYIQYAGWNIDFSLRPEHCSANVDWSSGEKVKIPRESFEGGESLFLEVIFLGPFLITFFFFGQFKGQK